MFIEIPGMGGGSSGWVGWGGGAKSFFSGLKFPPSTVVVNYNLKRRSAHGFGSNCLGDTGPILYIYI